MLRWRIKAKNRLEIKRDKIDVEIGALRNKIVLKKSDLKKYKLNQEAIEFNKKADIEIELIKTKINVESHQADEKHAYAFDFECWQRK